MRLYPLLVLIALLAGCATGGDNRVRQGWLPPDQSQWEPGRVRGVRLKTKDGKQIFVPARRIDNLLTAKSRLERVGDVRADLALVDTERPNAFATYQNGRPVVAFSLSYLDYLGDDLDAVASTMGHELAHISLGHRGADRQQREDTVQAGQAAGALLNAFVPFAGTVASLGVTAAARSFTRDEERAADDLGLRWAVAAGFNPCGAVLVMQVLSSLGGANIPLLSTHPGHEERAELAEKHASASGRKCAR